MLFSIFFLRSLGFDMKKICKKFAYAFMANTLQWANNACFIREWLQWRASCIREPLSDPRQPVAMGFTVCPKLLLPQAEPSKAAGPVFLCSPVGIKVSVEGKHSCPFHRGSTNILSLYFAADHPRLLNIYYHTTSSQWAIKSLLYLGLGMVTD